MQILYTKALALTPTDVNADGAFSGYAAKTGNIDRGGDIILRGAFEESLKTLDPSKVRVLWQHEWDEPIGRTFTIQEDEYGLKVTGELILEVARAAETRALVMKDAIDGLSIGFYVDDFSYENEVRIIKKATIVEYSFVTFAMNQDAIVTDMKSANIETIRDCENYLRDVCKLSKAQAKTFISKVKNSRDVRQDDSIVIASLMKLNNTLRGS